MIDAFVADASTAIAWVHPAQATPETKLLLDAISDGTRVFVPAIWPLEVSNALLVLVRREKLLSTEREAALSALQQLRVKIDHEMASLAFTRLSAIAADRELSVYDAAYFELAERLKLPLACKDGTLRRAASRADIKLL